MFNGTSIEIFKNILGFHVLNVCLAAAVSCRFVGSEMFAT